MSEDLRGPNVLNFNKVSMTQVNQMGDLQLRIYGGRIIFLSFFYLRERVFIISCMDFLGILMQFILKNGAGVNQGLKQRRRTLLLVPFPRASRDGA